ncbi:MAG: hypothetical protein LIO79_03090 [Rikenellaceae bacterium]|nr:hypothetical protein [Rikenellaceae bacterium]
MNRNLYLTSLILTTVFAILGTSCGRSNKSADKTDYSADTVFFFSGMFMYYADAPVLRDCATGFTLSVAMEGDYLRAERDYTSMDPYQGEYIYVQFIGSVAGSLLENGEGLPYTVRIDSLIGFDRSNKCDFEILIPGVYDSQMNRLKSNLRLTGSYEFIQFIYEMDMDGDADVYTGRWGRISDNEIVLIYERFNTADYSAKKQLTFDRTNDMLVGTEDGDAVIFKKTYL